VVGLSVIAVVPVIVLLAVLTVDLWVYADAKAHAERGRPVVLSLGSFEVNTSAAWFALCLVLWIVFIPLCIGSRD
jgi:hypothetical protein